MTIQYLKYITMDQPNSKLNLFTVLEQGDRKINKVHNHAIILVGLSRVGKSTTFNWILGKPMIGQGNIQPYYINCQHDSADADAAQIGHDYTSVTLVPNVYCDYADKESLIDIAGYQDTRDNYIGVIGVSYFLRALFDRVKYAKFIIVFNQIKFIEQSAQRTINTFNGFINMFKFDKMSDDLKKKLKKSISVVITMSTKPNMHDTYFKGLISKLQDPQLNVPNKQLIIQLIEQVYTSGRVCAFKHAVLNQSPEDCTFIQKFNYEHDWNYFNLYQAEDSLGQSPISVTFEKDYQQLNEHQKNHFNCAINQKLKSYVSFANILQVLIPTFSNNWYQFLNIWHTEQKIKPNHHKMGRIFQQVKYFLQNNDVYSFQKEIDHTPKQTFQPCTFIQSINVILEVFSLIESMNQFQVQSFVEAMHSFSKLFSDLIECLRKFASNNEQEESIVRLKYILNRGCREFSKLYQLNPTSIHDIKLQLLYILIYILGEDRIRFIERVISRIHSDHFMKLFPTLSELDEYKNLILEYQADNHPTIQSRQQHYKIELAKYEIFLADVQRQRSIHCLIRAFITLGSISQSIANQNDDLQQKMYKLNNIFMRKIKLISKIVQNLKMIPQNQYFSPLGCALKLCINNKMIEEACSVYQLLIDSPSISPEQKSTLYQDFALYTAKWGSIDQAIVILRKKLAFEKDNYDRYTRTITLMRKIIDSRETYLNELKINLLNWKRLPEEDAKLMLLLEDMQSSIPR